MRTATGKQFLPSEPTPGGRLKSGMSLPNPAGRPVSA